MKTGYFGNMKSYPKDKGYRFISIARFNRFWTGEVYSKLAPPAEIIKIEDKELYKKLYYEKVLNKLNPNEVYKELGDNAVLLCYEKWEKIKAEKAFCHRRIVADWLEKNIKHLKVKELVNEKQNTEQLSFEVDKR